MRLILFWYGLILILCSCQPNKNSSTSVLTEGGVPYEEYCASFDVALNGVFGNAYAEGTMTWSGGREGQVEISGADYNDMTCTYIVTDCENGGISMNCEGSGYNTTLSLFTPDSIQVGTTTYVRIK